MEYETPRKSSGVAKAGLTLGIIGTSLAVLGANGNGILNFSDFSILIRCFSAEI